MSASAALKKIREAQAEADELVALQLRASDSRSQEMQKYEGKPALYAKEVLQLDCWSLVAEIMESIHKPPYRTLVKSGHKVGKTNAAGMLINYWFDVFDPGVVITTGASWDAMCDTVWSEVRMQRSRVGLPDYFIGPVAPEMRTSPEHWAKLFSVNKPEAFQGKHRGRCLFLFDEAVGVERPMFTVASSMFKSEPGYGWICFYNPTDPSTAVYQEEKKVDSHGKPKWNVFTLSSLEHPNILKQREERKKGIELVSSQLPVPNAVSLSQIDDWVRDWCLPIDPAARIGTDFEWTFADGSKSWWRPQMDWEARCTGNWPSQATASIWSEYQFEMVCKAIGSPRIDHLPQVGADVARFGDDKSTVHSRWGNLSLSHAARQGLRTTETTGWIIEVATWLADMVNQARISERHGRPLVTPEEIPIKVDDGGVGGGCVDELFEQSFNVVPVNASGTEANERRRYPNVRSELWFQTARCALIGGVAFSSLGTDGKVYSRLDTDAVTRLKLQAMAPTWKMDSKGRRVVEKKEETKKRLGQSPDDMDGLNLAYYEAGWEPPFAAEIPLFDKPHAGPTTDEYHDGGKSERRRAMFGR